MEKLDKDKIEIFLDGFKMGAESVIESFESIARDSLNKTLKEFKKKFKI